TPDRNIGFRGFLEPPDRIGVEATFDPRPGAGQRLKCPGVHDLLRRPPDRGEVPAHHRRIRAAAGGLPEGHRLVYPAAIEVGADRPLEVVYEGMHLVVRGGPIEPALFVL